MAIICLLGSLSFVHYGLIKAWGFAHSGRTVFPPSSQMCVQRAYRFQISWLWLYECRPQGRWYLLVLISQLHLSQRITTETCCCLKNSPLDVWLHSVAWCFILILKLVSCQQREHFKALSSYSLPDVKAVLCFNLIRVTCFGHILHREWNPRMHCDKMSDSTR